MLGSPVRARLWPEENPGEIRGFVMPGFHGPRGATTLGGGGGMVRPFPFVPECPPMTILARLGLVALSCPLVLAGGCAGTPAGTPTGIIAPPPALTLEGVPPVPAALAAEVEKYTGFRPTTFCDWHPVRREML